MNMTEKKMLESFIQHIIDSGKHRQLEYADWDELILSFAEKIVE